MLSETDRSSTAHNAENVTKYVNTLNHLTDDSHTRGPTETEMISIKQSLKRKLPCEEQGGCETSFERIAPHTFEDKETKDILNYSRTDIFSHSIDERVLELHRNQLDTRAKANPARIFLEQALTKGLAGVVEINENATDQLLMNSPRRDIIEQENFQEQGRAHSAGIVSRNYSVRRNNYQQRGPCETCGKVDFSKQPPKEARRPVYSSFNYPDLWAMVETSRREETRRKLLQAEQRRVVENMQDACDFKLRQIEDLLACQQQQLQQTLANHTAKQASERSARAASIANAIATATNHDLETTRLQRTMNVNSLITPSVPTFRPSSESNLIISPQEIFQRRPHTAEPDMQKRVSTIMQSEPITDQQQTEDRKNENARQRQTTRTSAAVSQNTSKHDEASIRNNMRDIENTQDEVSSVYSDKSLREDKQDRGKDDRTGLVTGKQRRSTAIKKESVQYAGNDTADVLKKSSNSWNSSGSADEKQQALKTTRIKLTEQTQKTPKNTPEPDAQNIVAESKVSSASSASEHYSQLFAECMPAKNEFSNTTTQTAPSKGNDVKQVDSWGSVCSEKAEVKPTVTKKQPTVPATKGNAAKQEDSWGSIFSGKDEVTPAVTKKEPSVPATKANAVKQEDSWGSIFSEKDEIKPAVTKRAPSVPSTSNRKSSTVTPANKAAGDQIDQNVKAKSTTPQPTAPPKETNRDSIESAMSMLEEMLGHRKPSKQFKPKVDRKKSADDSLDINWDEFDDL